MVEIAPSILAANISNLEKEVIKVDQAGADYIQLYTGMVYKGPGIASKISDELLDILNHKGIKNLSEIIGTKN